MHTNVGTFHNLCVNIQKCQERKNKCPLGLPAERREQGQSREVSAVPTASIQDRFILSILSVHISPERWREVALFLWWGVELGVKSFPWIALKMQMKMVPFQSPCSTHCARCYPKVKWLLQTCMDFNAAALCSAGETLPGHWEPQTVTGGGLSSNISHGWSLDLWGLNHVLCRTLPRVSDTRPGLSSVGFGFLLLHCFKEKVGGRSSIVHLPKK